MCWKKKQFIHELVDVNTNSRENIVVSAKWERTNINEPLYRRHGVYEIYVSPLGHNKYFRQLRSCVLALRRRIGFVAELVPGFGSGSGSGFGFSFGFSFSFGPTSHMGGFNGRDLDRSHPISAYLLNWGGTLLLYTRISECNALVIYYLPVCYFNCIWWERIYTQANIFIWLNCRQRLNILQWFYIKWITIFWFH